MPVNLLFKLSKSVLLKLQHDSKGHPKMFKEGIPNFLALLKNFHVKYMPLKYGGSVMDFKGTKSLGEIKLDNDLVVKLASALLGHLNSIFNTEGLVKCSTLFSIEFPRSQVWENQETLYQANLYPQPIN